MRTDSATLAALQHGLPELDWTTDADRLAQLSKDYSWFSPVLKRQLEGKVADLAVRPRSEDELRSVAAACARHNVPVTVRGAATGNYGQIVPLHGGVLLDMGALNAFGWVRGGVGRAQAGIRLAEFDRQAQPLGWELRWLPSTFRAATLGGLFGGGFGGAGSVTYGPVAASGSVLGARVMSVEPEPRIVELRGAEAMLLHHKWGTHGIVLELEVALAPALPWLEMIATFESFDAGLACCQALHAESPGIVKKQLAFMGAPIPDYFTTLAEHLPKGCHAALMLVVESAEPAVRELVAAFGGAVTYRKTQAEAKAANRTLIEYCWNHTTLQALKVDKNLTYIQSRFDPARPLEQVRALEQALAPEVMMHVEFIRLTSGAYTCSGLQIVRFTNEQRLEDIMQIYRDHGATINNPHVYILEDGGKLRDMDRATLSAAQRLATDSAVAMKRRFDPQGLLNPGKLRSWTP